MMKRILFSILFANQQPSNFKKLLEMNKEKISHNDYEAACAALESLRCSVVYKESQVYSFFVVMTITFNSGKPRYWGDLHYA